MKRRRDKRTLEGHISTTLEELEKRLKEDFADNFSEGNSWAFICCMFNQENEATGDVVSRVVFGVPYGIKDGILEIGPYAKDERDPIPPHYHGRKLQIPLKDLLAYRAQPFPGFDQLYQSGMEL